ncbi:MAG: hypothetical protein WC548_04160 [Candidatus Pacearchaeota archaeon]
MVISKYQAIFMVFGVLLGSIIDGITAIIIGGVIGLILGRFM